MNHLNLQHVLENKCIFLFGKKGQGKSSTGNTLSGRTPFNRNDETPGVPRSLEIYFSKEHKTSIIDSPGILDIVERTLFHRAFIRSIESKISEKNLRFKLPIDIICIVTKFDETNKPCFLDVAYSFVKLFSRSGTFNLMIICIEKEEGTKRMSENDFTKEVETSDGYRYLMKVKRGDEKTTEKIPYCRWDNLAKTPEDMQRQIKDLGKKINQVESVFSPDDLESTIQLVRSEYEQLRPLPPPPPQLSYTTILFIFFFTIFIYNFNRLFTSLLLSICNYFE